MPETQRTFTHKYLPLMGQSLFRAAAVALFLIFLELFQGEVIDLRLAAEVALTYALIDYILHYHHTFNRGVIIDAQGLCVKHLIRPDQYLDFGDIRRFGFRQKPKYFLSLPGLGRLDLTATDGRHELRVRVLDLAEPEAFIAAVERAADRHGIRTVWQDEAGRIVTQQEGMGHLGSAGMGG